MTNREKYRFEEFTLINYRKLLKIAKENNFKFSSYSESHSNDSKQILLRHDVEFSPFIALEMAKIETEECVKATYFFQLHSETYNVLEKEISNIVFKVKSLGHDIGLHFDSHYFDVTNEEELEKYLKLDTQYFNTIFNTNIEVFSFHNTNPFFLSCDKENYAELINVYSLKLKNKFSYCADSTGFWRYDRLEDVLNNPKIQKLQVLTHDAMWSDEILSPRQRVFKSIDDNAHRVKQWYDEILKKFGAKNIDWNEIL